MAVVKIGATTNQSTIDDDKAIQADAACTAARNLLKEPAFAAKLSADSRDALQSAVRKAEFDLAVYRGELSKQQRRGGGGGMPVILASTQTMTESSAGTPFAVLVAIAAFAGAALGAVAAGLSGAAQNSLNTSLATLVSVSASASSTVARPLPLTPNIPKSVLAEMIRLGILIVEASIVSVDTNKIRRQVVETMKAIENLFKQNRNPCDDPYLIVRQLALQFFALLDRLPNNDNDAGQSVLRALNLFVRWMKAVNDLFNCFELPEPFPKA